MRINYYINNQEVNRPLNWAELSTELNFDKDDVDSQAVSVTEFEWGLGDQTDGNDAARLINAHRTGGLTGSIGVFEGLPFRIELELENNTYQLFNGYLDTARAIYDCDRVITQAVEKGNIDWLSDVADSVSFAYLYEKTKDNPNIIPVNARITNSDFVSIPYVLSELPNNREAFLAAVSLFLITETITNQLQSLIEYVAGIVALSWEDVIKIILRSIYIIGLLLTAYSLVKQIINLLIQPVKFHDGMRVKTLCEKGAAYFGFTFESTILDREELEGLIIIPEKYNHDVNTNKDDILGFLSPNSVDARGYFNGTFGELLRALKEMFNAKIVIEGTTLKLEDEGYNNSAYNYVLPPVDDDDYGLNFEDLKSNYVVQFQTDINDKNTLQEYEGTITQVITRPKTIINKDMVLMTGLETRFIPFARCSRKTELTLPEKLLKELADTIDTIANQIVDLSNKIIEVIEDLIKALNTVLTLIGLDLQDAADALIDILNDAGIRKLFGQDIEIDLDNLPRITWNNLGPIVRERIGMLSMENDFIDVAKIGKFIINDKPRSTNVSLLNDDYINSEWLYNEYHFYRSFIPRDGYPNANQYKKYIVSGIPFTCDDYELVRNSNYMQDSEGREGKIVSCRWNPEKLQADIEYRINEKYTVNLEEEIITPDGK